MAQLRTSRLIIIILLINIVYGLKMSSVNDWTYVNFTWKSNIEYKYATFSKNYVPSNNIITGIKQYNNKIYVALGRIFSGTPVTLGSVNPSSYTNRNDPLIEPFPSWEMNVQKDCSTLQNVYAIEIDSNGLMWIVDGVRFSKLTNCPAKIVLLDIKTKNIVQSWEFPQSMGINDETFLTDIDVDSGFAYIADNSKSDPGLIIYSKAKNRGWKVRDGTMYPQLNATRFIINGKNYSIYSGIFGVAVSTFKNNNQRLFYNSISSYNIYSINIKVLQDEQYCKGNEWRKYVTFVGKKVDKSASLSIDNLGNMYFGLLNQNALAKWDTNKPFSSAIILFKSKWLNWCNSFGFNSKGNLFVLNNNYGIYLTQNFKKYTKWNEINFRIFRIDSSYKNRNKYVKRKTFKVENYISE